jgi:hypothetical protein
VDEEQSLEGWQPQPSAELPLGRIIDLAFDYRGNTTVVTVNGRALDGYLFNRDADAAEPFIEMFDVDGAGPHRIPYSEIRTIRFTGKDTAAGRSYAAWQRRREQERGGDATSGRAHDDHHAR